MPHCKSCNTTLASTERHCPNCGRTASPGSSASGFSPVVPPALTGPSPLSETQPPGLPPEEAPEAEAEAPPPQEAAAPESPELPEEPPVEPPTTEEILEELEQSEPPRPPVREVIEDPDDDTQTQERPRPVREDASAGAEAMPEKIAKRPVRPAAKATPATGPASLFSLQPDELRARVAEKPEMLEKGLSIFKSGGKTVGAGYETEVGEIDLLAVDASGALVVVMVAPRGTNPVGPVLERLGWVFKHVAEEGQDVRAMVLLEPPAPELPYAAKAVAGTVAFKTYRVTVALDDVVP
jgi:hypothetical protein